MATTRHIIYTTADGEIVTSHYGDDASPPTAGAGQTYLDAGAGVLPAPETHKIVADVVTAKDQATQDAERDAARKDELERLIGGADACREAMLLRTYDVAKLDQEIADMVIERDALP